MELPSSSPPFNFGLHGHSAGHTLWQDPQGRGRLWPGEAVLMSIATYNNTQEPDVLLLNVFGRMLSLLPHEVILRPRLICTRQKGHYHCHELLGADDLLDIYGCSLNQFHQNPPLTGLSIAYCPCGFEAHLRAKGKHWKSNLSKNHFIDVALSGDLKFLLACCSKQNNYCQDLWESPEEMNYLRSGFIGGGHEKTLVKFLPASFAENTQVLVPTESEMLHAALLADPGGPVVAQWLRETRSQHFDVLRAIANAGCPAWLLRKAREEECGDCTQNNRQLLTNDQSNPAADRVNGRIEFSDEEKRKFARVFTLLGQTWPTPKQVEQDNRFQLWETALELRLVSLAHLPAIHQIQLTTPIQLEFIQRLHGEGGCDAEGEKQPLTIACSCYWRMLPRKTEYHDADAPNNRYVPGVAVETIAGFCTARGAHYYLRQCKRYFDECPLEAQRADISGLAHILPTVDSLEILFDITKNANGGLAVHGLLDKNGNDCVEAQLAAGRKDCASLLQKYLATHEAALHEDTEGFLLPF